MNTNAKITHLHLQNFTAFAKLDLHISTGINVIIGENATGKTHLMKLMYSILKGNEEIIKKNISSLERKEIVFADMLMEVFKPDTLGRLSTHSHTIQKSGVALQLEGNDIESSSYRFSFLSKSKDEIKLHESREIQQLSSIYIPPVEMLTIYPGFIANYKNRVSPYDKTFYDMAVALNDLPAKGKKLAEAKELLTPIEEATQIQVKNENGKFYLKFDKRGDMEAPLVAEGMKKLGMLIYLINNGSLSKNSILFWDEPEAHLNPKYITIVADLLKVLANRGVQIIVSTHDYLLSQRLSLLAESNAENKPEMLFISLTHGKNGTTAETAPSLASIQQNSILEEFALYADDEEKMMYSQLQ